MKKLLVLTLALLMALAFVSCDSESEKIKADAPNTENVGEVEEEEAPKIPTPDEEYLLYKDTYTKNGNYTIYDYNEKGHVIKRTTYYQNGDTLETNYSYTYNDDGSYSVYIEGIGKKLEEYDTRGRLVKETNDPTLYPVITTYIYDDMDRVIEYKTVAEKQSHVRAWHKHTYDDNGNLVKDEMFLTDGSSGGWYEYDYWMTRATKFRSTSSIRTAKKAILTLPTFGNTNTTSTAEKQLSREKTLKEAVFILNTPTPTTKRAVL